MKIKTMEMAYEDVMALPRCACRRPKRPGLLARTLVYLASQAELKATDFTYTTRDLERIGKQPALILMNHSSFIDLKIVSKIFYPLPYGIVCTSDGFVGKERLLRSLGCIPTQKFVSDVTLIRDMEYMLREKKISVLMYPEASYTFDGTNTPLPRKLGVLLKKLDVPVIMITTKGAFSRDPLYNGLQKRNVTVSAEARGLLTREEIAQKSVRELDDILDRAFTYDHFAWQAENRISISEPFRADGLNRILYKCARCGAEGRMEGGGTGLTCGACGKRWEMDEYGRLAAAEGETEFSHIPDWFAWERRQVRAELERGTYRLEKDVTIGMMVDYRAIYMVGEGHLSHSDEGFRLTGCGGRLSYAQGPLACYGLYADYYWYEIGDVICIGGRDALYYCFPKEGDVVAKTRMAVEELYKLKKRRRPAAALPQTENAAFG